ncbi:MAG: DUF3772 domain-containing protein [Pseudomonadota bacterium]
MVPSKRDGSVDSISVLAMVRFLAAIGLLLTFATAAFAQMPDAAGVDARRQSLVEASDRLETASPDDLLSLREDVRAVRAAAETALAPVQALRTQISADIERLGPAPEETGIDPSPEIAARRDTLEREFAAIDAIVRQADLNIIEATRLLNDIAERRREAFYDRVFERGPPPIQWGVLRPAWSSWIAGLTNLRDRGRSWSASFDDPQARRTAVLTLLISVAFAVILMWPARRWFDRKLLDKVQTYEPTRSRRVSVAGLRVLARAIPTLIAAWIIYESTHSRGIVSEETESLAQAIVLGVFAILLVDDLASAVFAPKFPRWRVIPLESARARLVRLLLMLTVIVFSINSVFNAGAEPLGASEEFTRLQSALVSIASACLLFVLARARLWALCEDRQSEFSEDSLKNWARARGLARVFSVLVVFAVLVGFVALGRFGMTRAYYLSFLFTGAWFSRALLGEFAEWVSTHMSKSVSGEDQPNMTQRREDERLYAFWFKLLIDIVLIAAVLPLAALILGVEWSEMRDWVFDALFGFRIGGFTISFAKIFTAFAAMFFILVLTRFIQRTSDTRIFAPARMDSGLRNTLRTLIGYGGLMIGVMAAIGALGFPLANLAIVAGALSLGIGFGLQSIVNNFVSGLILLFERPIKVGDWIITSSGEGVVKRISVRSTEIETFDWASIIVPNSELISSSVTNWTHKNRYSRIVVPVGVSYDSDPEEVSKLLLKCARENKRTLNYPPPVIYFAGYGDSSLDFEVRIFINNVDDRIPVQNELRFAIFRVFREANIEIPFPQRDLHVRGIQPGTLYTAGQPPEADEDLPADADLEQDEAHDRERTPNLQPGE